jgi:hypothetical protein
VKIAFFRTGRRDNAIITPLDELSEGLWDYDIKPGCQMIRIKTLTKPSQYSQPARKDSVLETL